MRDKRVCVCVSVVYVCVSVSVCGISVRGYVRVWYAYRTCVMMLGATCLEGGGLEPMDRP